MVKAIQCTMIQLSDTPQGRSEPSLDRLRERYLQHAVKIKPIYLRQTQQITTRRCPGLERANVVIVCHISRVLSYSYCYHKPLVTQLPHSILGYQIENNLTINKAAEPGPGKAEGRHYYCVTRSLLSPAPTVLGAGGVWLGAGQQPLRATLTWFAAADVLLQCTDRIESRNIDTVVDKGETERWTGQAEGSGRGYRHASYREALCECDVTGSRQQLIGRSMRTRLLRRTRSHGCQLMAPNRYGFVYIVTRAGVGEHCDATTYVINSNYVTSNLCAAAGVLLPYLILYLPSTQLADCHGFQETESVYENYDKSFMRRVHAILSRNVMEIVNSYEDISAVCDASHHVWECPVRHRSDSLEHRWESAIMSNLLILANRSPLTHKTHHQGHLHET
ncbi:hypothetical protein J6590_036399 [Homalodisca vitripennis]|nr:hypothetical protein J6590_036399 [Homalodisca vitripennis]